VLSVLIAAGAPAHGDDLSKATVQELIDQLTQVDAQTLGIDSFAIYSGFMADDSPSSFEGGLLGVPPPRVSPLMREFVRRGPQALPALVAHIGDPRPTKLEVGNTAELISQNKRKSTFLFMWMEFSDEYDPRVRELPGRFHRPSVEKRFEGSYTVKVGDICFALIGQIVGRRLLAVRYQPTGGLVVNSPVETPALAESVNADWGTVDADGLKSSLLADLDWADKHMADSVQGEPMKYLAEDVAFSALRRLRFYFPETYKVLEGNALERKREFEREEAAEKSVSRSQ
jgi:hypothetical protein